MALILVVFLIGIVSGVAGTIAALGAYVIYTARDLPDLDPSDKE